MNSWKKADRVAGSLFLGAIARSGLDAIAFKNGQASKLPIHSRELFKGMIARCGLKAIAAFSLRGNACGAA
jgi:hypothetical protein